MDAANPVLAFVEAFYRHRHRYRCFALRYVRSESVAEQIVDDCLLRLWERREQIEAPTIESYFYASLKFGCLNYLRDQQRRREIEQLIYDRGYRLRQYDIASLEELDPSHERETAGGPRHGLLRRSDVEAAAGRGCRIQTNGRESCRAGSRFGNGPARGSLWSARRSGGIQSGGRLLSCRYELQDGTSGNSGA